MVLLLLGLRATNQLLTITAVCVIEMADAYGAGNAFPKEASNTDDWLDAIGLVRPCSVQARCRITSPIVYKCGVCDPQSRCKEALAGMSLVDIVNMTDSERRERVPIDGQRKRLVAFLSARNTRTRALPVPSAHVRSSVAAHGCTGIGSAGAQSEHVATAGQVQLDLLPLHRLDHHEAVRRGDDLLRLGGAAR